MSRLPSSAAPSAQMLGNLIEQQIAAVYDWPFGATVALVLVATVLGINLASTWFFERRHRRHERPA